MGQRLPLPFITCFISLPLATWFISHFFAQLDSYASEHFVYIDAIFGTGLIEVSIDFVGQCLTLFLVDYPFVF